jgi:hypothetical protein
MPGEKKQGEPNLQEKSPLHMLSNWTHTKKRRHERYVKQIWFKNTSKFAVAIGFKKNHPFLIDMRHERHTSKFAP